MQSKRFGMGLALVLASLVAIDARAQDKIVAAYSGPEVTPFCMLLRAVDDPQLGFARKYNITFENIALSTAMFPVTTSNGDVNIAQCSGISTVFNAWNKGGRGLFVFAFGAKAPVFQVVVQPEIMKASDMAGKIIGVQGIQSAGAEAVEIILGRAANLKPHDGFTLIEVAANSVVVTALTSKRIDGAATYPPFSYALEKRGFKVLGAMADYVPEYVTGIQLANRAWVEKNPDLFNRLLKAMMETGAWFKNPANEGEAVAWIQRRVSSGSTEPLDAEGARRVYQFYVKEDRLALDGFAPESAVRSNLNILKLRGYITDAEIPPLGQVVDMSYINRARQELGMQPVPEFAK